MNKNIDLGNACQLFVAINHLYFDSRNRTRSSKTKSQVDDLQKKILENFVGIVLQRDPECFLETCRQEQARLNRIKPEEVLTHEAFLYEIALSELFFDNVPWFKELCLGSKKSDLCK